LIVIRNQLAQWPHFSALLVSIFRAITDLAVFGEPFWRRCAPDPFKRKFTSAQRRNEEARKLLCR
jgi:hypothetical protein